MARGDHAAALAAALPAWNATCDGVIAEARARGENVRAKLVPHQATFGIISIVLGVIYILWVLTH